MTSSVVSHMPVCLSGDPEQRYPVPPDGDFIDEAAGTEADFVRAPDLARLANLLIRHHDTRFNYLASTRNQFLWKRAGGKDKTQLKLGQCVKPSGLVRFGLEQADVIIWLAADHCRDLAMTRLQIEALLYHELSHTTTDDDDELTFVGHDVEAFRGEVAHYGLWRPNLREMAETIRQLNLGL